MKKVFMLFASAGLLAASVASAEVGGNGYVFGEAGFDYTASANDSAKDKRVGAPVFGLGVGYKVSEYLRSDISFGYRNLEYKYDSATSGNTKSKAFNAMLNLYLDVPTETIFTPYVGAGLGYARLDTKNSLTGNGISDSSKSKKNNLAFQAGLGTAIKMDDSFDIKLGYKYTNFGKMGNKSSLVSKDRHLDAHEMAAGIGFNW